MTVPKGVEVNRTKWVPLLIVVFGGCVRENSAFFESDDRQSVDQTVKDIRDGSILSSDITLETDMADLDDRDMPEADDSESRELETSVTAPLDASLVDRIDLSEGDGFQLNDLGFTEDRLDVDDDGAEEEERGELSPKRFAKQYAETYSPGAGPTANVSSWWTLQDGQAVSMGDASVVRLPSSQP